MKTATYTGLDGKPFSVQYDETAPCRICKLPVMDASMGGTDVCPWCDCGTKRPDKEKDDLIKSFTALFDDSNYSPDPIALEGGEAYEQRKPLNSCPYTNAESKSLWEHGWNVTNIGYIKAAEYGGTYDDPKNWI